MTALSPSAAAAQLGLSGMSQANRAVLRGNHLNHRQLLPQSGRSPPSDQASFSMATGSHQASKPTIKHHETFLPDRSAGPSTQANRGLTQPSQPPHTPGPGHAAACLDADAVLFDEEDSIDQNSVILALENESGMCHQDDDLAHDEGDLGLYRFGPSQCALTGFVKPGQPKRPYSPPIKRPDDVYCEDVDDFESGEEAAD